jgi:hypothetical protein
VRQHQLKLAARIERGPAAQHFVEHDTQRVQIAAMVHFLRAPHLLRRNVAGVAHHRACIGRLAVLQLARQREVRQLPDSAGARKNVLRIDVAMYDVQSMRRRRRPQQLPEGVDCVLPGNGSILEAFGQGQAFENLGGHHQLAFQGKGCVKSDHIRVIEAGADTHFAEQSLGGILVVTGGGGQGRQNL